jgi:hypothetical protein
VGSIGDTGGSIGDTAFHRRPRPEKLLDTGHSGQARIAVRRSDGQAQSVSQHVPRQ